jgi:purine-cytosine permease-like protein
MSESSSSESESESESGSTSANTSANVSANVTVRRSPRYQRFFFVGVSLGIVVAIILTFAFPADPQFSSTQVFGFLAIFTASIGAVLGLVFALLVDRLYSRHVIEAVAEHTIMNEKPASED